MILSTFLRDINLYLTKKYTYIYCNNTYLIYLLVFNKSVNYILFDTNNLLKRRVFQIACYHFKRYRS